MAFAWRQNIEQGLVRTSAPLHLFEKNEVLLHFISSCLDHPYLSLLSINVSLSFGMIGCGSYNIGCGTGANQLLF